MFATMGVPVTTFRVFRDAVTFLAGLALAGFEVLTTQNGEPSLIVLGLAATMMGLPGSLGVDRLLNRDSTAETAATNDPEPVDAAPKPTPRRHAR